MDLFCGDGSSFSCSIFSGTGGFLCRLLEFTAREIYQEVKPHGLLFGLLILILLLSCAAVMALPYNLLEKEKSFRKLCRGVGLLKKR